MFTKVRQVRAFESVIQQMEAAILRGSLSVGDRLPSERELQGLMDVSRNTLRESLRVLEQKGLVEIRKGHRGGIFVKEINADSMTESLGLFVQSQRITMEEISEFRQDLEGLLTRRAAYLEALVPCRRQVNQKSALDGLQGMPLQPNIRLDKIVQPDVWFNHTAISIATTSARICPGTRRRFRPPSRS